MTHHPEIWDIIRTYMPRDTWVSLHQIYTLVEEHAALDNEDLEPEAPHSNIPKWKRNVRNVLQYWKRNGEISWDGDSGYLLM